MRKLFLALVAVFAGLSLAATPVAAQTVTDPLADACRQGAQSSSVCQQRPNGNPIFGDKGIVTRITQIVTVVVGVAAVIMIIVGSLKYVLSSGDPTRMESAKNTVLFAVIGLVIAISAQAIVLFVLRRL